MLEMKEVCSVEKLSLSTYIYVGKKNNLILSDCIFSHPKDLLYNPQRE